MHLYPSSVLPFDTHLSSSSCICACSTVVHLSGLSLPSEQLFDTHPSSSAYRCACRGSPKEESQDRRFERQQRVSLAHRSGHGLFRSNCGAHRRPWCSRPRQQCARADAGSRSSAGEPPRCDCCLGAGRREAHHTGACLLCVFAVFCYKTGKGLCTRLYRSIARVRDVRSTCLVARTQDAAGATALMHLLVAGRVGDAQRLLDTYDCNVNATVSGPARTYMHSCTDSHRKIKHSHINKGNQTTKHALT